MKPLTIEELKSLEAGDWVWVVILQDAYRPTTVPYGEYYQIITTINKYYFVAGQRNTEYKLSYSDYDKTWLAYKNKEQAETKGEIVEVVEYNGYAPYLARNNICGQPLLIIPISEERNKELKEQGVEDTDLCVFLE